LHFSPALLLLAVAGQAVAWASKQTHVQQRWQLLGCTV
jgi:hypothetical protein